MRKLTCTISAMLLFFFCTTLTGSADTLPEIIARGKSATALVSVDGAEGSAFCINTSGLFVTNQHVVANARQGRVMIVLHPATREQNVVPAQVLRADAATDLAVLKLEFPQRLTALPLGSTDELFETMKVTAFGFPVGRGLALRNNDAPNVSVSSGHISALRSSRGELREIQLDAAINPGNSGGPVLNDKGQVIGIVSARVAGANNVNFAIPVSQLQQLLRTPVILFEPPLLSRQQMTVLRSFTFRIQPLRNDEKRTEYDVEFRLGVGTETRIATVRAMGDGTYYARFVPIPQVSGPVPAAVVPYQITVSKNNEVVATQSGALKIADALRHITPNVRVSPPAPQVDKSDKAPAAKKSDDDDWLGGPTNLGVTATSTILEAGRMLLQTPYTVVDAKVSVVDVNAGAIVEKMVWAADGKKLYAMESDGTLHVISIPDFREEKIAQMNQKCRYFGMCKLGLVIGLPDLQEVWLLDRQTLQVTKRITIAGMRGMAVSPALPLVYVSQGEHSSADRLSILDFGSGKVAQQLLAFDMRDKSLNIKKSPYGAPLSDFSKMLVTPDGGYLFCVSGYALHRFRIVGTELVYEEIGEGVTSNDNSTFEVSPDSKYVALPASGTQTREINGRSVPESGAILVFRTTDLSEPVVAVSPGVLFGALGFDRAGGKIYGQSFSFELMVFTPDGLPQKQYKLANAANSFHYNGFDRVAQFLPHPGGNRVLVLVSGMRGGFRNFDKPPKGTLYWVELPANRP